MRSICVCTKYLMVCQPCSCCCIVGSSPEPEQIYQTLPLWFFWVLLPDLCSAQPPTLSRNHVTAATSTMPVPMLWQQTQTRPNRQLAHPSVWLSPFPLQQRRSLSWENLDQGHRLWGNGWKHAEDGIESFLLMKYKCGLFVHFVNVVSLHFWVTAIICFSPFTSNFVDVWELGGIRFQYWIIQQKGRKKTPYDTSANEKWKSHALKINKNLGLLMCIYLWTGIATACPALCSLQW